MPSYITKPSPSEQKSYFYYFLPKAGLWDCPVLVCTICSQCRPACRIRIRTSGSGSDTHCHFLCHITKQRYPQSEMISCLKKFSTASISDHQHLRTSLWVSFLVTNKDRHGFSCLPDESDIIQFTAKVWQALHCWWSSTPSRALHQVQCKLLIVWYVSKTTFMVLSLKNLGLVSSAS